MNSADYNHVPYKPTRQRKLFARSSAKHKWHIVTTVHATTKLLFSKFSTACHMEFAGKIGDIETAAYLRRPKNTCNRCVGANHD